MGTTITEHMSASSGPFIHLDSCTQKKCSSCGKMKLVLEFSGRATCDMCRTRKRLRSAAQISERRETLGTIQLENQWLNHQIEQTAQKLKASEAEVAKLTALLRKHASHALSEHEAARENDVASNSRDSQPSSAGSCRGKPRAAQVAKAAQAAQVTSEEPAVTEYRSSIQDAQHASFETQHQREIPPPARIIQREMPLSFEAPPAADSEANRVQQSQFSLKRKAPPCEPSYSKLLPGSAVSSHECEQLDEFFATQFVYNMDELSQYFIQQQLPAFANSSTAPAS